MQAQPTTETPALRELHEHCTRIRQLLAAGYKNAPEFFSQQIKDLSRSTLTLGG